APTAGCGETATVAEPENPLDGSEALPTPRAEPPLDASVRLRVPPAHAALMPATVTAVTLPDVSSMFVKVNPSPSQRETVACPEPSRAEDSTVAAPAALPARTAAATSAMGSSVRIGGAREPGGARRRYCPARSELP